MLIGGSAVGKTAMIRTYIRGNFLGKPLAPTPGLQNQYKIVDVPGGGKDGKPLKIKLDIWDTSSSLN